MPVATVQELVEAGVHFGHPASRWHPKMDYYIFAKRNGVHIIDLRKTVAAMVEAYAFLRKTAREGGNILYVGTKRQAKEAVRREAQRVGMPFVSERWLGGTLTNLATIRQQIRRLEGIERIEQSGELDLYTKKELAAFRREKRRVLRNLEGIRTMTQLPQALLIVDPGTEHNAVKEARKLRIPVIAMLDTDADPSEIDVPIPANDDALRSVDIILSRLTDGIEKGIEERAGAKPRQVDLSRGFSSSDLSAVTRSEGVAAKEEPPQPVTPDQEKPVQAGGADGSGEKEAGQEAVSTGASSGDGAGEAQPAAETAENAQENADKDTQ